MTRKNWIVVGLAYIVGLWSACSWNYPLDNLNRSHLLLLLLLLLGLTISTLRFRQSQIRSLVIALLIGMVAVVYLQLRIPQPFANDISYQTTQSDRQLITVTGKVLTEPRLSNRQTLKFFLAAISVNDGEAVSGKLYASLPLLQGTGIYPGQELELEGYLYLPQPSSNNYGFDWQQYLARQGVFAGIQGLEANFEPTIPQWSWSQLRQKILRVQLQGLESPRGQLVSSMVLGRKAVDLPQDIRDRFIVCGLAHVLAASGFHVSLLLGIVLKLTTRVAAKTRLAMGMATLLIYLGLTGMQASVMRACLMGIALLVALTMNTKVKPLGSLGLAGVIILLVNPLLIDDLGFKLSFLATFGLIVTLPQLQTKLDWLPPTIATAVAIPLAASIWVLPLLSYEFNTVATYSLAVNIIASPLVFLISLGGMVSAIVGLVFPLLGSAIASLLYYPTTLLMALTEFSSTLPASTWSIGQMPLWFLCAIYGLYCLIWLNQWWQKRWWLGLIVPVMFIFATIIHHSAQTQISVLATGNTPIVIIRDRGQVAVINSGDVGQAKYHVLPFLAQQGINQIDYAIALDDSSNSATAWNIIDSRAKVSSIYETAMNHNLSNLRSNSKSESHPLEETIATKSVNISINKKLAIAKIQIANDTWLIFGKLPQVPGEHLNQYIKHLQSTVSQSIVVWGGNTMPTWLERLNPTMAIATSNQIDLHTQHKLRQQQIAYHNTALQGDLSWNPQRGLIYQQIEINN